MLIYILDDQYGSSIYQELVKIFPKTNFPIQENIKSPLLYLEDIIQNKPDYILLDNYFPSSDGSGQEEALGECFLEKFLKSKSKSKIICISDYGKILCEKYFFWEEAANQEKIIARVPSKEGQEIARYIN